MKIDADIPLHLTYCSNIHPGETWPETFANLQTFIPKLKNQLAPQEAFGIGLRLSNRAATELLTHSELITFHNWLKENNLYVFTMNGFPYGEFHHQRVKEHVYEPDWLTEERLNYCLKLVSILAEITPAGGESGFSTSPISYKPWLDATQRANAFYQASISLSKIVVAMAKIYHDTGKLIHIDIEPEPDCLLETIDETIHFFHEKLMPIGIKYLTDTLKITTTQAEIYLRRHVQVCYDICHSSVEFEKPATVFKRLEAAGIQIGKIQISAALKANLTEQSIAKDKIADYLIKFADSVYLHQAVGRTSKGRLLRYCDLPDVIKNFYEINIDELRVHFHVPIFLESYEVLQSTQDDIKTVLNLLVKNKIVNHLEIETYTWEVLPADLKLDLIASIIREYQWVLQQLKIN